MSKSISRATALFKYPRSACGRFASIPTIHSLRSASSHAGNHANYGPEYETHEGMGNSLFLATGVGIVGLALYHTYVPSTPENEQSLLTRHLAQYFYRDPEELKKIEDHNMAVVFDAADKAFFKASLERPAIRRMANGGNFGIASPYGVVPGTSTDLSDLRIKSYRDDLQPPNDAQNSHDKSS
ncbi:hypothetical protein PCANC_02979 [Puccinia coronata f. sp. avenae]|uniref:Uncharacterized protein n=1 Tax=Puccinia coronata f. sp. avenae TaxID=200324 RepID=A0A2N5UGB8_9BASI|nr:hypothetical protein PCANC_09209 [Puccinia coronata f. sp. avenae]PLW32641.1 hypothetical protein PCASD_13358 [Puccinia coronata f. sp. avenae]PLW36778.1 hypothetical protein PCASD_13254 [Puccinia coronata f. sp. avenae]PLW55982.1 hypothetical protein PCANC_02979 [Puccinia coronata f. sp. avenae]